MQRLCPGLALLNVASTGLSVLRCLGGVSRSTLSTLSKSFRIPMPGIPGIPGTMALFTTVHCRLLDAAMLIPVIKRVIKHVKTPVKYFQDLSKYLTCQRYGFTMFYGSAPVQMYRPVPPGPEVFASDRLGSGIRPSTHLGKGEAKLCEAL